MLYFILVLLINVIICSDIKYLEYSFSEYKIIPNEGLLKNTMNVLLKSGEGYLNTSRPTKYQTTDHVFGLRDVLMTNKNIKIEVVYKSDHFMNYEGEYCIFCLVKKKNVIQNGCSDIDYGITWKNSNLLFYLKNTQSTPTCKNTFFEVPLIYYGRNQTIHVNYVSDNYTSVVYINNKKAIEINRRYKIDISNWSTSQLKHRIKELKS